MDKIIINQVHLYLNDKDSSQLDVNRLKSNPYCGEVVNIISISSESNLDDNDLLSLPNKIIISSLDDETNITKVMKDYETSHLIGSGPNINSEIDVILKKHHNNNFLGIEKYLEEDAFIKSTDICHSKEVNDAFNSLSENLDVSEYFDSPIAYLKLICNELVTNSFYHLDTDAMDRRESVFLNKSEAVELKIVRDSKQIGISVKDSVGRLSRDKAIESLQRAFIDKKPINKVTAGAGLGLYLVFHHTNQLIINCENNKSTEVIALIDANKRYLNYKRRTTSFHYFKV